MFAAPDNDAPAVAVGTHNDVYSAVLPSFKNDYSESVDDFVLRLCDVAEGLHQATWGTLDDTTSRLKRSFLQILGELTSKHWLSKPQKTFLYCFH